MTEPIHAKATSEYFKVYAHGLVHVSVCTNLSDDEATKRVNVEWPTGIDSPWAISSDKTFRTGEPNPCPCADDDSRRHILFSC